MYNKVLLLSDILRREVCKTQKCIECIEEVAPPSMHLSFLKITEKSVNYYKTYACAILNHVLLVFACRRLKLFLEATNTAHKLTSPGH